jgi:hypothetical protein
MAFVDSYSFSHRFSDETVPTDYASYQEVVHQCSGVNATGLARQFCAFALGCGFPPSSIYSAMVEIGALYNKAYVEGQNSDGANQ